MKGFGSDNHSGIHPELIKSIIECNTEHAPSYGTDDYSNAAIKSFKNAFGSETEVFFVFNGTACNTLALRFLCDRHESILCSEVSHLNIDECGAPEFFAAKLIPLPHTHGKISLETLKKSLIRKGDQHYSQSRVVSITQPTEFGTCYSKDEIGAIADWAHQNQLYLHIDGARLTNALIELKCNFKEMTTDLGVDIVSFGGTKNGLMMGEAILVLNAELAKTSKQKLKYIRKQTAQLPSKTRFISAQFTRYLQKNLYLEIAQHSCAMAEKLYNGIKEIPHLKMTSPRQSNAVFVIIPKEWIKQIKEKYFFYVWNEQTYECRLMTSWDTTPEEVDGFIQQLHELSEKTITT
jgi:threonine aldolase